jgi:hypothetical protein
MTEGKMFSHKGQAAKSHIANFAIGDDVLQFDSSTPLFTVVEEELPAYIETYDDNAISFLGYRLGRCSICGNVHMFSFDGKHVKHNFKDKIYAKICPFRYHVREMIRSLLA